MTEQLSLDAPVRASDPDTSAIAAAVLDGANDRALVLAALRDHGGRGTADEVTDWLNEATTRTWQRSVVSSRLSQLCDERRFPQGVPVRDSGDRGTGATGRPVIVFEVIR